jgi:hypothetical protein
MKISREISLKFTNVGWEGRGGGLGFSKGVRYVAALSSGGG